MPRALASLLLALVVGAACAADPHRGDGQLQIAWSVDPDPPASAGVRWILMVSDMDWSPRNGLRVTLVASAEGTDTIEVAARAEGAGRYVTDPVPLSPGRWSFTVRAERPDHRWTERDDSIEVGDPSG